MTSSGRDIATPPSPASAVASGKYSMLTVSPLRITAVLIGLDRATPPAPAFALADGFRYILVTGLDAVTAIVSFWLVRITAGPEPGLVADKAATGLLSQLGPPTLGVFGCNGFFNGIRRFGMSLAAGVMVTGSPAVVDISGWAASSTVTSPLSTFKVTVPRDPVDAAASGQTPNVGTNAQYGS